MLTELLISIAKDLKKGAPRTQDNQSHIRAALDWLLRSQEVTGTGGYSSAYSLYFGWRAPFPETTGYIIPTMLNAHNRLGNQAYFESCLKAGQWLLSVQNGNGSFYEPHRKLPMVFDSGQIIFGLLALYKVTAEHHYLDSAARAGEWITGVQDSEGYWRQFAYNNVPHSYYSRVSWALLELFNATGREKYRSSAIRQLDWVVAQQRESGWSRRASFLDDNVTVLHTIAYTIEGLWESGGLVGSNKYLDSAKMAADVLLQKSETEGILQSYYREPWLPVTRSKCLTGLAQMSVIWLKLCRATGESRYLRQAMTTNSFLKSHQNLRSKSRNLNGAIASSYPIWGRYMPLNYLNWAAKFFLDALFLESDFRLDADASVRKQDTA